MEIKIQCGCGTKYKFDVEPINGRMPVGIACPSCGTSGVMDANEQIAKRLGAATPTYSPAPPPAPIATTLRINPTATAAAPVPSASVGGALLQRTTFFVKEHVSLLKLTDTYDILDPASGQPLGVAKEEPPVWAKFLRLVVKKHLMPTAINVYEHEGQTPVLSVKRGFTIIRSKLHIVAGDGRKLGYFRSKLISIGGGFHVFDHSDKQIGEVKGNWKGWDFTLVSQTGHAMGKITKKWAGLGKELFTSADNYIISLTDTTRSDPDTAALLLAAGLAIDVVYKENE